MKKASHSNNVPVTSLPEKSWRTGEMAGASPPANVVLSKSMPGAIVERTAAIRGAASPFTTRYRIDSGSVHQSTGARASGASPPPISKGRHP